MISEQALALGLRPGNTSQFTAAQADDIKRRVRNGESMTAMSKELGVSIKTVSRIARGETTRFADVLA